MKQMMFILVLVPFLSGCGTFIARSQWRDEGIMPRYYPATAFSGYCVAMPFLSEERTHKPLPKRALIGVVGVVDLPVSLVTDTICLPYDAFIYRGRADHNKPSRENRQAIRREQGRNIRDSRLRNQEESNKTNGE